MEDAFFGMFNWKLSSFADYLQVVIILGVSGLGMYIYTTFAKRLRKQDVAARRIQGKLQKRLGSDCIILDGISNQLDGIIVDAQGVLLLKVYPRGTEIYGRADSEKWTLVDRQQRIAVENPLPAMDTVSKELQKKLSAQGIRGVNFEHLIVFADVFEKPKLHLGVVNTALITQELKKFCKLRKKGSGGCDVASVAKILKQD